MEALVRDTLDEARKVGNPRAIALCLHALGAVLHLSGRWLESVEALEESVAACHEFDGVFGQVLGDQRLAQIETAIGQFEPAHERLQAALTIARRSGSQMVRAHSLGRIYATLALNRHESGDLRAAKRFLARGVAVQREVGECAGCDVLLYPAAVPVHIADGKLDLAEQACRKADAVANAFGSRSWVATARNLMGQLAIAHADWRAATVHLQQAADVFEEIAQPYDLARSLELLAHARSRGGGASEAAGEALVERAGAIYRRLGATFRAEQAGAHPPRSPRENA